MSLSAEHRWTLVGCGLIAHADDRLEVGEWENALALLEGDVDAEEVNAWLDKMADAPALEKEFALLPEVPAEQHEPILYRCWQMALSDGEGTEVEAAVHDRIADALGAAADEVSARRQAWSATAAHRAELALGIASVLANLDGRLDASEAAQFAELLERAPVPVNRRLELGEQLTNPPRLDAVVDALAELPREERITALRHVAPMVHASARGNDERVAFLDIARRVGVEGDDAELLLG